jgi:RNA polymerase sigma factor (sigma-70 family)
MTKALEGFYGWLNLDPCKKYPNHEALLAGLERLEQAAVQCVILKSKPSVEKILRQLGLPADLADDVRSESLVIFLSKIQKKEYQYHGNAPSTFFMEIARRVAQNLTRTNAGKRLDSLRDSDFDSLDNSVNEHFEKKERMEQIEQLLSRLGSPCSDLIRLRYLDGYTDEEVVAQKLAPYASVESLKVSRSQCMKKLRLMAKAILDKTRFF